MTPSVLYLHRRSPFVEGTALLVVLALGATLPGCGNGGAKYLDVVCPAGTTMWYCTVTLYPKNCGCKVTPPLIEQTWPGCGVNAAGAAEFANVNFQNFFSTIFNQYNISVAPSSCMDTGFSGCGTGKTVMCPIPPMLHHKSPFEAPMPGSPSEPGFHLLDTDAGGFDVDAGCSCGSGGAGGSPPSCQAIVQNPGAAACLQCAAGPCCMAYATALAGDPGNTSTALQCWAQHSVDPSAMCSPPPISAGKVASFNACMFEACLAQCNGDPYADAGP